MKIKSIIIDDEPIARDGQKKYINDFREHLQHLYDEFVIKLAENKENI